MQHVISSLPLHGRAVVHYYPGINVLSFDGSNARLLSASEEFSNTFFAFFRGARILQALKQSQMPPSHLFVEPSRKCNLSCNYCYASGGPYSKKRVGVDAVRSLVQRYDFDIITVLGGEPLIDHKYFRTILEMRQWRSFFMSTNGVFLDGELLSIMDNHPEINCQVSIEPEEWRTECHQEWGYADGVLRPIIRRFAGHRLEFRVTIPSGVPHVSLERFIQKLTDYIGTSNFEISYWPATGKDVPSWLDEWISESYRILLASRNGAYKNKMVFSNKFYPLGLQAAKNKLPGIGSPADLFSRRGLRFFFCDAGYGSISVGPDGRLYGCHSNAINKVTGDVVSSEADGTCGGRNETVDTCVWGPNRNMGSPVCSDCPMRYICGGGCFNEDQPN